MISNLEQVVLDQFRQLSLEKQQELLQFLEILQQGVNAQSPEAEAKTVNDIISKGLKRAMFAPSKSTQEIWSEFAKMKDKIANQYEEINQNY